MNKKKESKVVPNVRFKGVTDDWKQRKLLSCIQKIIDFRGRTPKKLGMDWSESGYLALSALNVKDGYIDFSQDVHYGDQALYDKWMSGNELHKGQVLFTTEAPMGNVAQVPYNKQYILSQRTIAFDVKEDIITENFLATLLKSPVVFNTLTSLSSGGTAKGVSQKSLAGVDVRIPVDLREQTLLATYFHNIDHLITLHQRKVESLIKFKKGMLQKMFPKEGCDIPEIRFKGCYDEYGNWVAFTDPWEQRKFDEVFDCTIPSNTLSRAELNYESGSVRNIHYGDILIKYGSVVDVKNDEIPFATGKSSEDFKSALLQDGDIIIADTAEDETTGKACEIGNSQGLDVVSGLHTMVCRPRNKMALGYLGYYLNSDAYHHQLLPLMQGIKVLSLSRTNVQKTMVCYPQSKAEQQLIADCFRNLDHLITLHQRKLDMLKKLKSACLSEMFI